jgi:GrpB-like predicted nucleotidyltransferase (UPF0157 family)
VLWSSAIADQRGQRHAVTASGRGNPDEPIENEFLIGGKERRAIVLADYDPSWPVRFQDERAKLTTALGTEAIGIEHIGSTAVPGLAAKPIIDVLVTVADIEDEPRYLPALQRAGYVLRVREPGHRMVRTPGLDVQVHIWPDGDPAVTAYLALRNRLRSSIADRDHYGRPSAGSPSKTGRRWTTTPMPRAT